MRTKRVFAVCVCRLLLWVSSHPSSPIACSHGGARYSSGERAYLFHTNNSSGTEKCSRREKQSFKTNPTRTPSPRLRNNPWIPPYSDFQSMGTLCCCTLQTLPPKVYSNSTRHSAGWKEKKSQGKVGKSTNKNPENTTTTCSEWSRSQKEAQSLPASLRRERPVTKQGPELFRKRNKEGNEQETWKL